MTPKATAVPAELGRATVTIPLRELTLSPFNPRRTYVEAETAELAASLKAQGQLQPILVRPVNGKYEVLDGSRRFMAAQQVGASGLDAIVRGDLTDDGARRVVLIANLQRVDLPPLEEAVAIAFLLHESRETAHPGGPVGLVAEQIGKSPGYVARRARLTQLIPEWKGALLEHHILLAHALLIAPYPPMTQDRAATEFLFERQWTAKGTKRGKRLPPEQVGTVPDLREVLARLSLNLTHAPFPLDDAILHPPAGACTTCPKRAGNDPTLFGDLAPGTCLDPACYGEKVTATVARFQATHEKAVILHDGYDSPSKGTLGRERWVEAGKTPCQHTVEGMIGDGPLRGTVRQVCTDTGCAKHWTSPARARGERVSRPKAVQEREAEARREQADARAVRVALVRRLAELVAGLPVAERTQYLVEAISDHVHWDAHRIVAGLLGLEPVKEGSLRDYRTPLAAELLGASIGRQVEVGVLLHLAERVSYDNMADSPHSLVALSKRFKLDAKALERTTRAELAKARAAKAAAKHAAKQATKAGKGKRPKGKARAGKGGRRGQ